MSFDWGTEGGRIAEVAARVAPVSKTQLFQFYFVRSSPVSDSQSSQGPGWGEWG